MCLKSLYFMHFSFSNFFKTFTFIMILLFYDFISCINNNRSESVHLKDDQNLLNSTLEGNESLDEDLIILSSWESMKIWSSSSTLHSSKKLLNFDILDSDKLNRKITAIDYYYNEHLCENVLVWCDISRQTIYSGILNLNVETPYFTKMTKLLQKDFGNHLKLAVDNVYKNVYIALYELERIDSYNMKTNSYETILSNISHPVDIAIDSKLQVLFWIENWTCIAHTSISNTLITRMCSSKPRALAVDTLNTQLYWSDSDGNIFTNTYFNQTYQMISSTKKMKRSYAMDLSNDAIYMSDQYKLTSLMRSTMITKVVLIESPGISDFKVIRRKSFECQQQRPHNLLSNGSLVTNNTGSDETFTNFGNITDFKDMKDLIVSDYSKNKDNENNIFHSKYIVIICGSVLVFLTLICLVIILTKCYCYRNKRNEMKRNRCEVRNKLTNNDKSKLILNRNVSKTVCIEDLGSFSNNGFIDQRWLCTNCPIKQTCSSCQDKEQCIEKGICLSTYKLLT